MEKLLYNSELIICIEIGIFIKLSLFWAIQIFISLLKSITMKTSIFIRKIVNLTFHILGINFQFHKSFKKYKLLTIEFIIMLHLVFFFFDSLILMLTFNKHFKFDVKLILHTIQIVIPHFLKVFVVFQAYKKRKIQCRINHGSTTIENSLINRINKFKFKDQMVRKYQSRVIHCDIKFLIFILILIAIRIAKNYLRIAGYVYVLSTMIPEFIYSSSDFYFVYCIDILTNQLKLFNSKLLNTQNVNDKDVKQIGIGVELLYHHSRIIMSRFSLCIFFTITYNFTVLIINLYWMFLRISYQTLNKIQGKFFED